jgi:ABC-type oligopeptide transport system ATPase subunit
LSHLLQIKDLKTYYPVRGGIVRRAKNYVRAVDDVTLTVQRGECLGLVGESGCGKTTLGKTILRLERATEGYIYLRLGQGVAGGREVKADRDVTVYRGKGLKWMRRKMQIVFQDPSTSLNPRMLIKNIIGEAMTIHRIARGREKLDRVVGLLNAVGLNRDHLML